MRYLVCTVMLIAFMDLMSVNASRGGSINAAVDSSDLVLSVAISENPGNSYAQTFSLAQGGSIESIGLQFARRPTAIDSVRVRLVPVISGIPDTSLGNILLDFTVPHTDIPINPNAPNIDGFGITSFDVSGFGVSVLPGEEVALVLSSSADISSASNFITWDAGINTFQGGKALSLSPTIGWHDFVFNGNDPLGTSLDLGFTINTEADLNAIPTPTAAALVVFGGLLCSTRRPVRRR